MKIPSSAKRLNGYWLVIPARHHPFLGMDPYPTESSLIGDGLRGPAASSLGGALLAVEVIEESSPSVGGK